MLTNTSMTVYHRTNGSYIRTYIDAVMWQDVTKYAITDKGMTHADETMVFVPWMDSPPAKGDTIVKGRVSFILKDETGSDLKALRKQYSEVRDVISVDTCDYGSADRKHWEVIAQ